MCVCVGGGGQGKCGVGGGLMGVSSVQICGWLPTLSIPNPKCGALGNLFSDTCCQRAVYAGAGCGGVGGWGGSRDGGVDGDAN